MNTTTSAPQMRRQMRMDIGVSLGLSLVAVFFVLSGAVSYMNIRMLNSDSDKIAATHEVILGLNQILSTMKDAETGQRGFVLTGDEAYLTPYDNALTGIEERVLKVEQETQGQPDFQRRLPPLKSHIAAKMNELAQTISARRESGYQAALDMVRSDRGKADMDAIRAFYDRVHAQGRERRQPLHDAGQVSHAVAGRIRKGTRIDLVDHGGAPPLGAAGLRRYDGRACRGVGGAGRG